jgi:hypothetical protein
MAFGLIMKRSFENYFYSILGITGNVQPAAAATILLGFRNIVPALLRLTACYAQLSNF